MALHKVSVHEWRITDSRCWVPRVKATEWAIKMWHRSLWWQEVRELQGKAWTRTDFWTSQACPRHSIWEMFVSWIQITACCVRHRSPTSWRLWTETPRRIASDVGEPSVTLVATKDGSSQRTTPLSTVFATSATLRWTTSDWSETTRMC